MVDIGVAVELRGESTQLLAQAPSAPAIESLP